MNNKRRSGGRSGGHCFFGAVTRLMMFTKSSYSVNRRKKYVIVKKLPPFNEIALRPFDKKSKYTRIIIYSTCDWFIITN